MSADIARRARVWIVDDSRGQADVARRSLDPNYDVAVFHDGATALEHFASEAPDVLVLDWHMPHVSGLDVCRYVRQSHGPSALPVLILTATADAQELVTAFELGANDFVRKPCNPAELNARIAGLERSRRLYAQLNAAEATLRDEARFRERFIAALGHDLRQPLTAITALAQAGSRQGDERATRIMGAAQRMGRMIDDVLDLSRTQLGAGMTLRRVPLSLGALAERVADEQRGAHGDRSIVTRFVGDVTGEWDYDRLAQVCSNLLDNALKHGASDAPVFMEVRGDAARVTMTVRNAGPRISSATLSTLFDAFRQGTTDSGRSGLGLGLFIVDQIVRAHGGSVRAESDLSATTLTVDLPRAFPISAA